MYVKIVKITQKSNRKDFPILLLLFLMGVEQQLRPQMKIGGLGSTLLLKAETKIKNPNRRLA